MGPTGGSDSGEGREPLLPSAVGPRGRKRLAYMPRVSKAGCHPFIIFMTTNVSSRNTRNLEDTEKAASRTGGT